MSLSQSPGVRVYHARNPRTGEHDYHFDMADDVAVEKRCAQLKKSQENWRQLSVQDRVSALQIWHKTLTEHRDEMIVALVQDTGRYHESALEVDSVLNTITRWCHEAPLLLAEVDPVKTSLPGIAAGSMMQPFPLVGVISPWNFPFLLSVIDAIPALLCGCAVIVKPSEITSRFVAVAQKILQATPLADVFDYVCGDGQTGAALIPHVDLVVFTGSVATGRKVYQNAAQYFIPAFLELGGKDPAIVCADADIERAAAALAWGGLVNAGQSCLSIERIYVDASIHDEFIASLTRRASSLRLCIDDPKHGEIGPVISQQQADIIQRQLDDAFAKGAHAMCGGKVEIINGGSWCAPTILKSVTHDMKVMTEETFGPVLPVMSFQNEQQAIALANDSLFGLSAAVFSADQTRALHIAAQLDAGAISINDCALTAIMHEGEKQSFKLSGLGGSRMGPSSMRRFLRKQALLINQSQAWDPWWFHAKNS